MGRFHRAVLVADTAVVARGRHAVVRTQALIAFGEVFLGLDRKVLVGRREAVGAVLRRSPAQAPQGLLQPLGQGAERLPAQYDLDVAPAAVGQAKMVETMRQGHTADPHHAALELGEVRQSQPAGLLYLAEHDLLVRPMQGLPRLDAALEGALPPVAEPTRVTVLQILEQGRGVQSRLMLQQPDHLAVPDLRERIFARAPVPPLGLQHADPTAIDPPPAALADPRLGAGLLLRLPLLSVAHV